MAPNINYLYIIDVWRLFVLDYGMHMLWSGEGQMTQNEMMFCHGCGARIHSTAPNCPQCGAAQQKPADAPPSGKAADNGVVWVLAFAPLIGYLLEYVVAYLVNNSEWSAEVAMRSKSYWYITLLLNIGLSFLDEKRLEHAGCDTSKFKGMVWLVPVYLYQRAQALHHNLAYFIVWLVCFALILFV